MDKTYTDERLKNIIDKFSKWKIEYFTEKEECKKLREANTKLELELKEIQELAKSRGYHLQNTREMIENLQQTVSQLVYLKRDAKRLSDEIISKECTISALEREKEVIIQKQNEVLMEVRMSYEAQIEEVKAENENKIRQIQQVADTEVAQYRCANEELRSELNEAWAEHRDKTNTMVLEYEEKMQRCAAQNAQLQDQLCRQSASHDANIDAYRRKIAELEEKLKQYQFKEYLANNAPQHNVAAERPYSVNRETSSDHYSVDLNQIQGSSTSLPRSMLKNTQRAPNAIQVTYSDVNPVTANSNENKGQFKISKKRKLYNVKDFQDF
ncbi:PREDICTED: uncharacterized protein LOC106126979 [Papilio xuthus]|uniref:Uncharacterized protein LOC106126979 n=1 Tax=Papilio xuthus TaxID=66420 RepID=A0AAJ6ZW34_PAPXU|nr:PREDICTED: uncharacterized protein LOC106126979 [Papilio xuthus]